MNIEPLDNRKLYYNIELPEGHLTANDMDLLYNYSKGKKCVVDIGTFKGRAAVIESINAEKVYTIDYFPQEGKNKYEDVKNILSKFDNIELINNTSWDCGDLFDYNTIDLLVQDGDHSIDGIGKDMKAFLPKMTKDGIIMIHDYKYMDGKELSYMNVQGAVKKLIDNKILKQIAIIGWYWIGVKV